MAVSYKNNHGYRIFRRNQTVDWYTYIIIEMKHETYILKYNAGVFNYFENTTVHGVKERLVTTLKIIC